MGSALEDLLAATGAAGEHRPVKQDSASQTAAVVAAARALGAALPAEAQLALDPYGLRFVYPAVAAALGERGAFAAVLRVTPPLRRWIVYMQVRTRVIDDVLRAFLAGGGRQVVLLGAGYDARAHRLAPQLAGCAVFEIDHPATQRRKRRILERGGAEADLAAAAGGPLRYLPWDFERAPMSELPAALQAAGLRAAEPTLTIWEGVTMYLTQDAIEATVAAVRGYSARASQLVFTYFDRQHVAGRAPLPSRLARALVAQVGEPWRWGWSPEQLPGWLAARQLTLLRETSMPAAAAQLLPPRWAKDVHERATGRWTVIGYERVAVAGL